MTKYSTEEERKLARKLSQKKWREKNPERVKQLKRESAKRNRAKINTSRRDYYKKKKGKDIIVATHNRKRQKRLLQYREYMQNKICERCSCNDHRVLVWHHKDPNTKIRTVYSMANLGISWNTILAEIAKCECLCQNCHVIEHSPEKSRIGVRQKYKEFMIKQKCNRCSFNSSRALEWHHKNTSEKTHTIARMLSNKYSWKNILLETNKCECLCRNCHHIETHYSSTNYCHKPHK
jgi:hypothetical protein